VAFIVVYHPRQSFAHKLVVLLHELLILDVELLLGSIVFFKPFFDGACVDTLDLIEVFSDGKLGEWL